MQEKHTLIKSVYASCMMASLTLDSVKVSFISLDFMVANIFLAFSSLRNACQTISRDDERRDIKIYLRNYVVLVCKSVQELERELPQDIGIRDFIRSKWASRKKWGDGRAWEHICQRCLRIH